MCSSNFLGGTRRRSYLTTPPGSGLPDAIFAKNTNLGKIRRPLEYEMLWQLCIFCFHRVFYGLCVYLMVYVYNLWPLSIFNGLCVYLMAFVYILWPLCILNGLCVYFVVIWYALWSFGMSCGHLVCLVVIWYTYFLIFVCCILYMSGLPEESSSGRKIGSVDRSFPQPILWRRVATPSP
jgi:hypothetical protein